MAYNFEIEESNLFGKNNWVKTFTSIDFQKGLLDVFENEQRKKKKLEVNIFKCQFYDSVKYKNRPCTIRISPYQSDEDRKNKKKKPKSVYLSAEDLRGIDEFKVELEECQGTFEGIDKGEGSGGICACNVLKFFPGSGGAVLKLENVDVALWTKKDVLEWLRQIKMSKQVEKLFQEHDIDGTIMDELDESALMNIGVTQNTIPLLLQEVNILHKNRKFNRRRFAVKDKIEKFPGFDHGSSEFQDMIDYLCDVAKLKHKFLSTASLRQYAKKMKENESLKNDPIKMQYLENEEMETSQEFRDNKIKIKLVVTEILHSKRAQNIRKVISPVLNALGPKAIKTDFGFFHTAIIVGPWYLEWTDSELVIPKRMVSGKAIISADVDTIAVPTEGLKEISDKIAEVVVKWNTLYKYRNTAVRKGSKQFEGNCQDFVDDILAALAIEINFQGALGMFVEKMRATGKCILEFAPGQEFREHFGIAEKSFIFKTHEELDTFCLKIKEKCLDVFNIFSSEWGLLKSFDRAFWLRHLKLPDDDRYRPLPPKKRTMKEYDSGCVFGHPYATKTYVS